MSHSSILYRQLRQPNIVITGGQGCYLFDENGSSIIDASSGAAVSCIGHNNTRVHQAIKEQLEKIEYCYSLYFTTPVAEELAKLLTDSTDGEMSKVFVVGSGAEATEAALKLARQYFTELAEPQPQRSRFISREQSYHGNTLGALSISGHPPRRELYEDILSRNTSRVSACNPYRGKHTGETDNAYVARLAQELDDEFRMVGPDTVCAFIVETICGSTMGAAPAVPGYFKAMKEVCQRYGALFIMDEVLCGMGRTGTTHAWQQEDVAPDLQTIAKGLGAGYCSIGALLINKRVVNVLEAGTGVYSHSQTYQGHPIACAAALEVQKIISEKNLLLNVRQQGKKLEKMLRIRLGDHPNVGDIRGRGLLWGMEFVQDITTKQPFPAAARVSARIHAMALNAPYNICFLAASGTLQGKGDYIALAPPFNVTEVEIETMADHTARVVNDFFAQRPC